MKHLFIQKLLLIGILVGVNVLLFNLTTLFSISYPMIPSAQAQTQCAFDTASCSWDAVTGAASYNIKITQVESGTVIRNDSVGASTTRIVFPVIQGKTYQCDISAVNSCGATGGTGSHSLTCEVGGIFPSVTPIPTVPAGVTVFPTATPTFPPAATTAPTIITQITPTPTLPPTGDLSTTIVMGVGGVILAILGGIAFIL